MENLEEVLQALDEFQKMRPSEIPRELEDYLCWVAKTGDPVYQWSLIKTLFREKLTRVMTDFYESCPTLDLAPCPNVEHFNYDTMKSNLLERLESFANAPFTVQRICELLTAPRKEYNRVDKFMRAIEKNILVVSTREPGPLGRRNENGDGMVNGSVDEDTSITQPPQDVEMEYWEKDCSSTVTVNIHAVENETPLLQTVIPTTTVVKNVFSTEESSHEKVESISKSDNMISNFVPATSEFTNVSNLTSSTQVQDAQIESTIQNLSTMVSETSGIVSDVSEAIMNEDTSSQPSLELENEGEITDSSQKLQTTFQTKDFSSNESKSLKFYVDDSKVNEKTEVATIPVHAQEESNKANDILIKSDIESKITMNNKECITSISENVLSVTNENLEDTVKSNVQVVNMQVITNTHSLNIEDKRMHLLENVNIENTCSKNNVEKFTNDISLLIDNKNTEENTSNTMSENTTVDVEKTELMENSKSIVEKLCSKDNLTENFNCDQKKNNVTVTENVDDETRIMKSLVPDPISTIEAPKGIDAANVKVEDASSIIENPESENLKNQNVNHMVVSQSRNENTICTEDTNTTELKTNNITITTIKIEVNDTISENTESKKVPEMELMEVDEEETVPIFQQNDELMEQEAAQSTTS